VYDAEHIEHQLTEQLDDDEEGDDDEAE